MFGFVGFLIFWGFWNDLFYKDKIVGWKSLLLDFLLEIN